MYKHIVVENVLLLIDVKLFVFLSWSFTLVAQAGVQQLTATSASQVQVLLVPQLPKKPGLRAYTTKPG